MVNENPAVAGFCQHVNEAFDTLAHLIRGRNGDFHQHLFWLELLSKTRTKPLHHLKDIITFNLITQTVSAQDALDIFQSLGVVGIDELGSEDGVQRISQVGFFQRTGKWQARTNINDFSDTTSWNLWLSRRCQSGW